MSFVALGFLSGLAALALPWWLHHVDTHSARRLRFPSLMLMRESTVPVHTEKRLRYLLLLALRAALIVIAVLAFAQPLLTRSDTPTAAAARVPLQLIVVDTSMSMQRTFDDAIEVAASLVDSAQSETAIASAAHEITLVQPFTADRAALRAALEGLETTPTRLDFDGLLERIRQLAESSRATNRTFVVHLVSDFQATGAATRFNRLLPERPLGAVLHRVSGPESNWAITTARRSEGHLIVTVDGHATPASTLPIEMAVDGDSVAKTLLDVPADGNATWTIDVPPAGRTDGALTVALDVADAVAEDNIRYLVIPGARQSDVPVIVPEGMWNADGLSQRRYLATAMAAAGARFRASDEPEGAVLAVIDPQSADPTGVNRIERHLERGGGVLVFAGPGSQMADRLGDLPRTLSPVEPGDRRVVVVDRSHALGRDIEQWNRIVVARAVNVDATNADVVLALDDGQPLLVEQRRGAGRVLTLTSALDPEWSNFVREPVFVTWLDRALRYLTDDLTPDELVAGATLRPTAAAWQLFDADGNRAATLADTSRGAVRLTRPGVYTLRSPRHERKVAVNAPTSESDLAALDTAFLDNWQTALTTETPTAPVSQKSEEDTITIVEPLAPWLLLLLLIVAAGEALVANTGRITPAKSGASTNAYEDTVAAHG